MRKCIATVLLALSFVTGCAGEASDEAEPRARRLTDARPIQELAVSASPDQTFLTYGADVVRVYPPEAKPPADLTEGYVVLDVWPVEVDTKDPVKVQCGGPAGGVCTSGCQGTSCTSGPPPPVISPYAAHPNKLAAQRWLEELVQAEERLVTDVEVLQEILHRYTAIDRRDAIQPAFDALRGVVDDVFAIDLADAERAKAIVLERRQLSARDSLHAAVMERHGVGRILSFDRGFDTLPGVTRMP